MPDSLKLPILSQMLPEGFPYGKTVLVEYDSDSEWFATLLTFIAQALRMEHPTEYATGLHSPADVRHHLLGMGVDANQYEDRGVFRLIDSFSLPVGLRSEEKLFAETLQVAEQSIEITKQIRASPEALKQQPGWRRFGIGDHIPVLLTHNDEKAVIEYLRTRMCLRARKLERAGMTFIPRGIYNPFLYSSLELAYDGVMDIVMQDSPEGLKNLLRLRSFKMVKHNKLWYRMDVGANFEVGLETLRRDDRVLQ